MKSIEKKEYKAPVVEKVKIDNEVSLVMASPTATPPPVNAPDTNPGGDSPWG